MLNPMVQVLSLYDKGFLKKSKFQAQILHFVDFDWRNASKWIEWHIFRIQGMPNPMALVSGLYNKWFLKIKILGEK